VVYSNYWDVPPYKLGQFSAPSDQLLQYETDFEAGGRPVGGGGIANGKGYDYIARRHQNELVQTLFMDGHVEPFTYDELADPADPMQVWKNPNDTGSGWFDPNDY